MFEQQTHFFYLHRFAILFALLCAVILIPPYFQDTHWVGEVWRGLFTCVLFWALYTIAGTRHVLLLGVIMLLPTASSTWLATLNLNMTLDLFDNLTTIVYFGLITFYMGRFILNCRTVTIEVIFAAMCLYIILAILWAAIFTNIHLYYGDAFTFYGVSAEAAGITKENLFATMVYYSFITLSTLGYGDIIPVHRVAQNWAAMGAMMGQFFIAIVMARLVSLYTVVNSDQVEKEQNEAIGG